MISYNVLQKRLISQKYKKCSPGKYAMLLYVAVSIRWISIRFDFYINTLIQAKHGTNTKIVCLRLIPNFTPLTSSKNAFFNLLMSIFEFRPYIY